MNVIIGALAPVLLIMFLGYLAGRIKLVDNRNVALLNIFVMDFALPAALFVATVKNSWAGLLQEWPLLMVLVLSMWILYALFFLVSVKVFGKSAQDAAVLSLTVALPNYAALGLPILDSVQSGAATVALNVAVAIAAGSVFMTPVCLLTLEGAKAAGDHAAPARSPMALLLVLVWRSLKKPIVLGPVIGCLLSLLGITMPDLVLSALKPLGAAAPAAALFLTGVILSARKLQINRAVILGTLSKNLLQGLLAWALVSAFGFSGEPALVAVLMLSLAAGFFGVVFGNRYGVSSPDAESTLLLSSVFGVVTIPLFIHLVAKVF